LEEWVQELLLEAPLELLLLQGLLVLLVLLVRWLWLWRQRSPLLFPQSIRWFPPPVPCCQPASKQLP
jgi:hypothetical protein